ncbi:MAG: class I SAM-dependent methyltransferase [Candidatus Hatepunaea meridiana]|nr:class I SAM-dependent methyltransferase [Candidatus Hatepunaea meridiana]
MSANAFYEFWIKRNDAGHRYTTEEWLKKNAEEILCLFPVRGTLVDVGCGNAQLLSYWADHFDRTFGIDFSPTMLEAAQKRIDGLKITEVKFFESDACHFPKEIESANLIIGYQVAQNLSKQDIRKYLRECKRILHRNGMVGICSIPWRNLKQIREVGGLGHSPLTLWKMTFKYFIRTPRRSYQRFRYGVMANGIGFWYSRHEIKRIAEAEGFDCEFVNSWYYEYRFHAILRLKQQG